MLVKEFDYRLPEKLIAQKPAYPRDSSRLLVINRKGRDLVHTTFSKLFNFLDEGDLLVANDTRVFPARLKGIKGKTKGKVEVLLLEKVDGRSWKALVKPSRRLSYGLRVNFGKGKLIGEIERQFSDGTRVISFSSSLKKDLDDILMEVGEIPLPPYVKESLLDTERYQTVYGKVAESSAAPTAGLHFTSGLIEKLKRKGVSFTTITLRIGLDTFRPVTEVKVENHRIHKEYYRVSRSSAEVVNRAKKEGKKIVAVGTTSARVLETVAKKSGESVVGSRESKGWRVEAKEDWTDLFIYSDYKFKVVDAMITNFHLPRSTLLMMVSAFGGKKLIFDAYKEAINKGYQFFSFGDAMLIL